MAIYPSLNLSPQNISVDMAVNQVFTAIVSGSPITHYQIKIYDITVIPNTLQYDSTKLALTPNLTNNALLSHTVPLNSVVNNKKYKWYIDTWSGASTATSRQVVFNAYASPVVGLTISSPVTTQSLSLTATYTQAQSVPPNSFYFELYDSTNELLEKSDEIYSFELKYEFSGLESGKTYKARVYGNNQAGMTFDTGLISFNVSYSTPQVIVTPTAVINSATSNVSVEWGAVSQIVGSMESGTATYVDGLAEDGGKALSLDSTEIANFNFNIPLEFTCQFLMQIPFPTTGTKLELKNGYLFGFEGDKFYADINGTIEYSLPYYPVDKVYFVVLRPTSFYIFEIDSKYVWSDFRDLSWADVFNKGTWYDVLNKN